MDFWYIELSDGHSSVGAFISESRAKEYAEQRKYKNYKIVKQAEKIGDITESFFKKEI